MTVIVIVLVMVDVTVVMARGRATVLEMVEVAGDVRVVGTVRVVETVEVDVGIPRRGWEQFRIFRETHLLCLFRQSVGPASHNVNASPRV